MRSKVKIVHPGGEMNTVIQWWDSTFKLACIPKLAIYGTYI